MSGSTDKQESTQASGQEANASNPNPNPQSKEEKDYVAYETHQRLLSQRKKDQERLAKIQERLEAFEEQEREREQRKLEEKGEYQKILEERENRIKALEEKMQEDANRRVRMEKESAFKDALSQHGKLASDEYLSFVDFDSIAVDSESGSVDQGTLQHVLDTFMDKHGRLIERPNQSHKIPDKSSQDPKQIFNTSNNNLSPEEQLKQALGMKQQ